MLKVRLPLLSDHALKYIINEPSSLSKNEDCVALLKEVLNNKEKFVNKSLSLLSTHRYYEQKHSNILVCGGRDRRFRKRQTVRKVKQIDGSNFQKLSNLSSIKKRRHDAQAVCLKGDVYVFGGYDENDNDVMTIEKYSVLDDRWCIVAYMYDNRRGYCICSFMDKIYILSINEQIQ